MRKIRLDNILPPFVSDWMEAEGILDEYLKYARINLGEGYTYGIRDLFIYSIIAFEDAIEDGSTIYWVSKAIKFRKFLDNCGIHEKILRNENIVESGVKIVSGGHSDTFCHSDIIKSRELVMVGSKALLTTEHKKDVFISKNVFTLMKRLYNGEDISISPLLNNVFSRESLINIANASNNQK